MFAALWLLASMVLDALTPKELTAIMIGIAIGQVYDGTARPLSLAFVTCGLLSLGLVLYSERRRLFRRLIPPGGERVLVDLH